MKLLRTLRAAVTGSLLLSLSGTGALAQEKTQTQDKAAQKQERRIFVEREHIQIAPEGAGMLPPPGSFTRMPGGDTFVFLSTEMSLNGKVVKGAPYSAEAVTEFTQTLADGNRIVRKNSATVYRDSEGRTRRDQTLGAIGGFPTGGESSQTFFINDPVAKTNYVLDPRTRTARKLPSIPFVGRAPHFRGEDAAKHLPPPPPGEVHEFRMQVTPPPAPGAPAAPAAGHARVMIDGHAGAAGKHDAVPFVKVLGAPQKESLGQRTVEGVEAEGTRITHTIAAGEIGNEQPINIVSESWYSPELQTIVMSRHSDPRVGETVYRLTNINRAEPARTLFEIPSDYTVKEMGGRGNVFVERRKGEK